MSQTREPVTGYRKTMLFSLAQKVMSSPSIVKFIEIENRMVVARDWGEEAMGGLIFSGCRVSDSRDEKSSEDKS